jgi:hypothetical protein
MAEDVNTLRAAIIARNKTKAETAKKMLEEEEKKKAKEKRFSPKEGGPRVLEDDEKEK